MASDFNFDLSYVDMKDTYFDNIEISETEYGEGDFEYKCKYKIFVKFKDITSDNRSVNKYLSNHKVVDSDRLFKHYNKRPMDSLKDLGVTNEDIKEDTVNYALSDYVNENKNNTNELLKGVIGLFGVDIIAKVYNQAYTKGKVELEKGAKVTDIEFDNRRHETDYITIKYEDGTNKTVKLNKTVTDDDVDKYIPGKGLFGLYYKVERWLQSDYASTIELLNNIFGLDVETLKGGSI